MAKKDKKPAKKSEKAVKSPRGGAEPVESTRWTVRGVPARLQKAAGDAARAKGMTLGQWLTDVLDREAARVSQDPAASASMWATVIEERMAKLEKQVFGDTFAAPPPNAGAEKVAKAAEAV